MDYVEFHQHILFYYLFPLITSRFLVIYINTYYINALDAHGSVFYRIIGDSGSNTTSTNESGDFHTTTVTVNGAQYKVLNASEDSNVTDAFKVQELY